MSVEINASQLNHEYIHPSTANDNVDSIDLVEINKVKELKNGSINLKEKFISETDIGPGDYAVGDPDEGLTVRVDSVVKSKKTTVVNYS